jgi:tetratricopeptide (TPR) repeat protein
MLTIKKKGPAAKINQEQEILTFAHKVTGVLSGYTKQIIIAASALAVVLVISAGYSLMRAQQEKKAAPLVAEAYEYYSPTGGMGADYSKALGLYREIQKKYPNTKSGAAAQYYIGNCLVDLGQMDEGLREYGVFINRYSGEKLLLGLVYQRMGYVYSVLGKQADAVKAFEQSETAAGPGVATVELARLYEASGNIPESQKKYKVVMEKLSGTSWGMEAISKVQKIETAPLPSAGRAGN